MESILMEGMENTEISASIKKCITKIYINIKKKSVLRASE